MNTEEACNYLKEGGAVTNGGYMFLTNKYYCAYGTYPGCVRAGDIDVSKMSISSWEAMTEKDIVCSTGYAYDTFAKPVLNDNTVDFNDLRKYLENKLTVSDYHNPIINSKYCKMYFEESLK